MRTLSMLAETALTFDLRCSMFSTPSDTFHLLPNCLEIVGDTLNDGDIRMFQVRIYDK